MMDARETSARDHSVAVGRGVHGDVTITHVEGKPRPPAYEPPALPDPGTIPDPGPLPPGSRMVFRRNANFTGRTEPLRALARALLHGPSSPPPPAGKGLRVGALVTQAVHGMGGVGKTQLAVEFAFRYGRFFHGVHWINAVQPDAIGAEIAACGANVAAAREAPFPDERPDQIAWTLAVWRRGGPRLVVLDNLEKIEVARTWLARLSGGAIRVLLTARQQDWPSDLGLGSLRLELFTSPESRDFLRHHLPEERASAAGLDALAKRLGHLPLALELAGRYLKRHPRKRVEDYLAELDQVLTHRSMQAWREDLGNPTGHDLDLLVTFAVSWEEVTDEAAQRLFLMAGYCAPNEPIPYELLQRAAELDQDACDRALNVLTGLGLLELTPPLAGEGPGEGSGPTIHPLLAEYARHLAPSVRSSDRREELSTDFEHSEKSALANVLLKMTHHANETGLPERFKPVRPHARAVAGWAEEAGLEQAGTLWNNLGYHLWMVADYQGARAAYEQALRIDEAAFGPDHPNVARDANNLGGVQQTQGDLAGARASFEWALRIKEQIYEPDHPSIATTVNNLGGVQQAQGDLAGARTSYEQALRIDEAVYGPNHPNVAIRVNNLGGVLKAVGELAGARVSFERALRILEEVLGPEHPEVATLVNNLGGVQQDQGDLAGARASYERALRIDEAVYGPDHPNVARDVNNLGSVQRAQGDLAGARASYERALLIDEAVYGPNHPNVAIRVNNLGLVQQNQGNLAEARASYERALHIWRKAYGEAHPQVATAHNNLGSVQQDQGDLAGARASYERALRIDEAAYGPDHPNVARDVNNLGSVLKDLGDLAGARDAFERALAILERSQLPPDHPYIKSVKNNLMMLEETQEE